MIVDWIAGLLCITANYFIGKKKRVGWVINMAAQLPIGWLNWKFHLYGFYPMQGFLLFMFIRNYKLWGNPSSRENS